MDSLYLVYAVLGIFFCIFFYKQRMNNSFFMYSNKCMATSYFIIRSLPLLIMETRRMNYFVMLLFDMAFLILVSYLVRKRFGSRIRSFLVMHYIYSPIAVILLAYGNAGYLVYSIILTVLLLLSITVLKSKKIPLMQCYSAYVMGTYAVFLYIWAWKEQRQTWSSLTEKDPAPMILLMGIFLIIAAAAAFLICIKYPVTSVKSIQTEDETELIKPTFFSIKNLLDICILTIVMFLVLIFRLGNTEAPSTEYWMYQNNSTREIVLDFGKNISLSKLEVFLGHESKKKVSLSYPSNGEWVVYDSQHELKSVFAWNSLGVNGTVRYLGIVLTDDEVCLREMVAIDQDGNQVLPVNADQYAALFDEQEKYPGTPTYYDQTMFDEVYHGRTAYEFLQGFSIYENTHPPLGKLIIAIGIAIFGMNPFGWRIINVCCGTLMIPLAYLWGLRLGGKRRFAWLASVLMMTGFMHFTLSRIATIDITVGLFLMAVYYFMFCFITTEKKYYLWLDGISLALAVSTKWTGFYAAVGIAILFFLWFFETYRKHLREKKKEILELVVICVLAFICIPGVVYTLSYIPFVRVYPDKNLFQHVISNGQLMLNYHSHVISAHPYESQWYEWIADRVPLLDAYNVLPDGKISVVKTFLNPITAWGGIPATCYCVYCWRCKNDKTARTLVIGYLSMLLPWLAIHRTVFIYQYYGSSLFLVMCICYAANQIKRNQCRKIFMICLASIFLFGCFYPVLSGYPVSETYLRQLAWLPRW